MELNIYLERSDIFKLRMYVFFLRGKRIWLFLLVGFLHILVNALKLIANDEPFNFLLAFGFPVVFGAFVLYLWYDSHYAKKDGEFGHHLLRFDSDQVYEKTDFNECTYKWTLVYNTERFPGFFTIWIAPYLYLTVPEKTFGNKAEYEEFCAKVENWFKNAKTGT